jgi:hypothetical protein
MAIFGIGALLGILIPAYSLSPRVNRGSGTRNWHYGDVATLIDYSVDPQTVQPGETVRVTLYWLPQRRTEANLTEFIHLIGVENAQVGSRDTYPGLGNDPTIYWLPGQVMVDTIPVRIKDDAQGPILLDIEAGLYELKSGERLPITDGAGNAISYPVIGTVKLADTANNDASEASIRLSQADHLFVGGPILDGYKLSTTNAQAGDTLTLTLYWKTYSSAPTPTSYKVFIHLLDAEGNIAAQVDGVPRGGRYPTTAWSQGESFDDPYQLALPNHLPKGNYQIEIGFYDPVTGARLPLNPENDSQLSGGPDHFTIPEKIHIP